MENLLILRILTEEPKFEIKGKTNYCNVNFSTQKDERNPYKEKSKDFHLRYSLNIKTSIIGDNLIGPGFRHIIYRKLCKKIKRRMLGPLDNLPVETRLNMLDQHDDCFRYYRMRKWLDYDFPRI